MATRIDSLRRPPIAFAHGGAAATELPHSADAFALGRRLGASGAESGLWLTADDVPVVAGDGSIRRGLRRRSLRKLSRAALGDDVVDLRQCLELIGPDAPLLLSVGEEAAIGHAIAAAPEAVGRLWLATADIDTVRSWRTNWPDARIVNATRLSSLDGGPERRAAALAAAGVDSIQLPFDDWTGGLTTLFHRFGVECIGGSAPHSRMLDDLIRMGCDGVSSPHVDRLVDAFARAGMT